VHLHPRAQAELATLFVELIKHVGVQLVVETHSDYLLDRIRTDLRDRKDLSPEDIAILFFERKGLDVKIHELSLDEQGNLKNVPASYRKFFLDEEQRLLRL
jgi:predicted ATPase